MSLSSLGVKTNSADYLVTVSYVWRNLDKFILPEVKMFSL